MRFPGYSRQPRVLEELQHNQQGHSGARIAQKYHDDGAPSSPTKSGFANISLKSIAVKDGGRPAKAKEHGSSSPSKPKKSKSATNLAGLLSRPKSTKNLKKQAEEAARLAKDKENLTPPSSVAAEFTAPPPPIFAQFTTSRVLAEQRPSSEASSNNHGNWTTSSAGPSTDDPRPAMKQRPKSFQPPYVSRPGEQRINSFEDPPRGRSKEIEKKGTGTWGRGGQSAGRSGILGAFPGMGSRTKSSTALPDKANVTQEQPAIDPKDIDRHLEAMLDRRNIPENQRYKMRNLNDTIKMEFIRQDWAESVAKSERPGTNDGSDSSMNAGGDDDSKKTSRGRSLTLSRAANRDKGGKDRPPGSPAKKAKGEGTLGRHFRSRSTDSVASTDGSRPASSNSGSNIASGILAKVKLHQGPLDYVAYLRRVQKPELVEVGKLHKLRLLLRNETVAWAEEFISAGGMKEIVALLHRIMEVEWR